MGNQFSIVITYEKKIMELIFMIPWNIGGPLDVIKLLLRIRKLMAMYVYICMSVYVCVYIC